MTFSKEREMTQSDLVKIGGGIVVGVLAAGVLAFLFGINLRGDIETAISVAPDTRGVCVVDGKATVLFVLKGKRVAWKIRNYCDSEQTVSVGNFRTTEVTTAKDCKEAVVTPATYPFTDDSETARSKTVNAATKDGTVVRPGKGSITLKVQNNASYEPYYFDVCLGGKIAVDPRLIVER
jgi:hypothetical protein